jgi:hypothetical protein
MPTKVIRWNLLVTDVGFLLYWSAAALGVFPTEWLYKDYDSPIIISWNWSFAPIDLAASVIGLYSLALAKSGKAHWRAYALVSASLTFCAGLMAISFWTLQRDFNPSWWLPNLYLAIWPLVVAPKLARMPGEA